MRKPDNSTILQCLQEVARYYSQSEIAEKLGVQPSTVGRWLARETEPKPYVITPLQQMLLPFGAQDVKPADFTFIDLFAGIGGIRKAFELEGGRCVFTSEWDSYAQKTYHANFADGQSIAGDITTVDAEDVPDHDVLLAGFPCQPFSIAGVSKKNALGRAHGFADATQGTLFFDVARIIAAKRPRAFVLENVKNLQSHDKGRTFDVILRTLREELGYHVHYKILDGQHFTPQHRERIVIVGFREATPFSWDALQLPEKGGVRMRDILHKTDGSEPVLPHDGNVYFDRGNNRVNDKYTLTPKLWQYLQDYSAKHKAKGNGFGFGLVYPDGIARTLSARYYKDGSEILVWQGEGQNPRRLTPRECARLMGYPDDFRIPVSDTRAYRLFADAAMPPMMDAVAKLVCQQIKPSVTVTESSVAWPAGLIVTSKNWTREQVLIALNLYCQLPFGKLHKGNPLIIETAKLIGRTPSSLAMKLTNLASLDPAITESGRRGLSGSSALDKAIWQEFQSNPDAVGYESQVLMDALVKQDVVIDALSSAAEPDDVLPSFFGENTTAKVQVRVRQSFFRKAILSGYENRCCMTGLSDSRLLVASHIVPWAKDEKNRLNPANGLCLSSLHDKAYDRGLITVTPNFVIKISPQLKAQEGNKFANDYLIGLDGNKISLPKKFLPLRDFLDYHHQEIFLK